MSPSSSHSRHLNIQSPQSRSKPFVALSNSSAPRNPYHSADALNQHRQQENTISTSPAHNVSGAQSLPSSPVMPLSSPIEDTLRLMHAPPPPKDHPYKYLQVTFLVTLPVPTSYDVAITGDIPAFGNWDISHPLYLRKKNTLEYTAKVKLRLEDLIGNAEQNEQQPTDSSSDSNSTSTPVDNDNEKPKEEQVKSPVDEAAAAERADGPDEAQKSHKKSASEEKDVPDMGLIDRLKQSNYVIKYKYITLLDGCPMSWETANRKMSLKWWVHDDTDDEPESPHHDMYKPPSTSSSNNGSRRTSPLSSHGGSFSPIQRPHSSNGSPPVENSNRKASSGTGEKANSTLKKTEKASSSQDTESSSPPPVSPTVVAKALLHQPSDKFSIDKHDPTTLVLNQQDGIFGSSSLRKFGRNVPSLYKPVDSEWIYNNMQLRIYQPTDASPRIDDEDVVLKVCKKARLNVVDTDTYVISASSTDYLYFHVDIHDPDDSDEVLARAFVTYDQLLNKDVGEVIAPFIDKKTLKVTGHFRALFLLVKPFFHQENNLRHVWRTLNWEQQTHMKGKSLTKFIGHRGLGKSRSSKNRALITENSMLSFQRSSAVGVDYIEFDVQLTKDMQPVIFHDFHAKIRIDQKNTISIPIQDLHLKQLTKLGMRLKPSFDDENVRRLTKLMEQRTHKLKKSNSYDLLPTIGDIHSEKDVKRAAWSISEAFATLKDCFDKVPIQTGFNIEIKWPIDMNELANPNVARNVYIDHILKGVFDNAGPRHIMFSSFDPDICTLLNLKQPRYPVFFLTEAGTATFPDHRCNSIPAAVSFARAVGLRGIVADCRPIIKNPSWIPIIHEHDLMIATFGEQNTLAENIKIQQDMGIDAIICDNVDRILRREKEDRVKIDASQLLTGGVTRLSQWMGGVAEAANASSNVSEPQQENDVSTEGIDG